MVLQFRSVFGCSKVHGSLYVLKIIVCPFVIFLLAIVLSVLFRFTDSDYLFGILKLFLQNRAYKLAVSDAIIKLSKI